MHDEEHTERDGVLSYSGEWHALIVGVAVGVAIAVPIPGLREFVEQTIGLGERGPSKAMREARSEAWYALVGLGLGLLVALALWVIVVWALLVVLIDVAGGTVGMP